MKRLPLLLLLIGSFALTASSDSQYHKRYVNCDYGYSVEIPTGVVVHGEEPPAPNHGFGVNMRSLNTTRNVGSDNTRDYLYVGAEYNVYDSPDDRDRAGTPAKYIRLFLRASEPHTIQWSTATFGGLRAARAKTVSGDRIEEWTVAFRGGIIYEFHLRTATAYYRKDRAVVDRLTRGFKLLPLPKGECSNEGAE